MAHPAYLIVALPLPNNLRVKQESPLLMLEGFIIRTPRKLLKYSVFILPLLPHTVLMLKIPLKH